MSHIIIVLCMLIICSCSVLFLIPQAFIPSGLTRTCSFDCFEYSGALYHMVLHLLNISVSAALGFIPGGLKLALMPRDFIPGSLTHVHCICFWCSGALYPVVLHMFIVSVSDALRLYTRWSYTCFAKVSFNLDLTFNVNDFVPCSCSSCYHTHMHHLASCSSHNHLGISWKHISNIIYSHISKYIIHLETLLIILHGIENNHKHTFI